MFNPRITPRREQMYESSAAESLKLLPNSAGRKLYDIMATNQGAATLYLHVQNSATEAAPATVKVGVRAIYPGDSAGLNWANGKMFADGILVAISTSATDPTAAPAPACTLIEATYSA